MSIFAVSDACHHRLDRFRRNTWGAISLCSGLRLADAALGFGLVEPVQPITAQSDDALVLISNQTSKEYPTGEQP